MRLTLLISLLCALCINVHAQRSFTLKNSPDGKSELLVFLPDTASATEKAVLCCPGGGYSNLCDTYEGTDWVPYYNKLGIALAVLRYRMPHGDRSLPVTDAYHAMKTLRDSATVWNINPHDIGIMGFSAGGHLASTVATQASADIRPDFQILFYPVISMDASKGHKGSSRQFLGSDIDNAAVIREFSSDQNVHSAVTPPAILFMAADDKIVNPYLNGVAYFKALRECGVSASIHIYPTGGHGWQFSDSFPYHAAMLATLTTWLSLQAPK